MSKSGSDLFAHTAGANRALVDELVRSGEKCTPDNIVGITREPNTNQITWLETGNNRAGLNHIIDRHGSQFNGIGIANNEISNFVMEAIHQGNIVGTQGTKNPRTVYEFVYEGIKRRVAVTIGSNGFVVGANLQSMKED